MMRTDGTRSSPRFVVEDQPLPNPAGDVEIGAVAKPGSEQEYEAYLKEWNVRIRQLRAMAERAAGVRVDFESWTETPADQRVA